MSKLEIVKKKALALGATDLVPAKAKAYKYTVTYNGKKINFGSSAYEDYLDHKDDKRRASYLKRSAGIKSKGELTLNNKNSANYWSRNVLW